LPKGTFNQLTILQLPLCGPPNRIRSPTPNDISCSCRDARKNKREGYAYLKPLQTLTAGIPFGRLYSAAFSVR
jgi:hypothetical protein